MAQLRQRVSVVSGLKPFAVSDTGNYIQLRLRGAGCQGGNLFTPSALASTAEFTEGIPRNINNFCFSAMSLACALRKATIDSVIVQEVISDLDISQHMSQPWEAGRSTAIAVAADTTLERRPPKQVGSDDALSTEQARAYFEQIARSLKDCES